MTSDLTSDLQELLSQHPFENCWPLLACDLGHCHVATNHPHLVSWALLATKINQSKLVQSHKKTAPLQDPEC